MRRVGYLFTDIDASTEKWERSARAMGEALVRHDALVDAAIAKFGGRVVDRAGDGIFAVFTSGDALACAVDIQLSLQSADWSEVGGLWVRIGVHCDPAAHSDAVERVFANRAARVMSAAWGGQILATSTAMGVYGAPPGCEFIDLGAHQLKGIDEPLRLFSLSHPQFRRQDFAAPRTLSAQFERAPVQSEPIFGRDSETAKAVAALGEPARIVTLAGPGGVGKTRLALEIAASLPKRTTHCFVDLENQTSVAGMIAAISASVRLPLRANHAPEAQLCEYLGDRALVVILDNADAIEGREVLERLGARCPGLAFLVTRREAFGCKGEEVIRLGGLGVPADAKTLRTAPAALLFAQSARKFEAGFELGANDFAAFVEICRLTGATPLALQLVAQWTKYLSLTEIVEKLGEGVSFLDDLKGESGAGRTLASVFEGSWALLSAPLRDALIRLSVFRAAFDLEAAGEVAGADAPILEVLENKCLLERRGRGRFVLHPLVHEFASAKLADLPSPVSAEARLAFSARVLRLAPLQYERACGVNPAAALDWFAEEEPNVQAAFGYMAASGEAAMLRAAAEPIFYAYALRSAFREGELLFSVPVDDASLSAYFSSLRANCLMHQGQYERTKDLADEIIAGPWEDWPILAHAHQALANWAHAIGDRAMARRHYLEALGRREAAGDVHGSAYTTVSLAWLHVHAGDMDEAKQWVRRAYDMCQSAENAAGMQPVQLIAGDLALLENRIEDAAAAFAEVLRLSELNPSGQWRVGATLRMAEVSARRGRIGRAIAQFGDASEIAAAIGDRRLRVTALIGKGRYQRVAGDVAGARDAIMDALEQAHGLGGALQTAEALLELARLEREDGDRRRALMVAGLVQNLGASALAAEAEAEFGPVDTSAASADTEAAVLTLIREARLGRLRLS